MRKAMTLVGLVLAGSAWLAAPGAAQTDIGGTWEITIEGPEGPAQATAVLAQEGQTFTGSITMEQVDVAEIDNGVVDGTSVSFVLVIFVQGTGFQLEVAARVDGDSMSGDMLVPQFGSFPFTAVRAQ